MTEARGRDSHTEPKRGHLKTQTNIFFYISSRATLNQTFTAKYNGVLPRRPKVRPKSEIYTPKRDDEHPCPFHMRVPPGGGSKLSVGVFVVISEVFT